MPSWDDLIKAKFDALLLEAKEALQKVEYGTPQSHWVGELEYKRFRAEVANLIDRVCGKDSAHYQEIRRIMTKGETPYHFPECFAILQAAYRDYTSGMLVNVRLLVRADLIDDLLDQAEQLQEQGYHVAAASLIGAVLEDTLRKLCEKHGIGVPKRTNINGLNSELAKAGVYDQLTQKHIHAEADLRNNADHGYFEKVRSPDVQDMLRWVRRFVEENLR